MSIPEEVRIEAEIAALRNGGVAVNDQLGARSTLTCPDCGGVIWEMGDQKPLRYRCHVGHAITAEVLAAEHAEAIERALWLTIKTLEESGTLALRLAGQAEVSGDDFARELLTVRARHAANRAGTLREILIKAVPEEVTAVLSVR